MTRPDCGCNEGKCRVRRRRRRKNIGSKFSKCLHWLFHRHPEVSSSSDHPGVEFVCNDGASERKRTSLIRGKTLLKEVEQHDVIVS